MNRIEQRFIIIAVALAAVVAGALFSRSRIAPLPAVPEAASQLLALTLPDTAGERQSLAQWRGKIMVVNFWATWCPPCREEIPGFGRLSQKYAGRGVQFIGIGIDSADKIRGFAHNNQVPYPLLIADESTMQLTAELGNRSEGLPFTVILDRTGATHKLHVGRLDEPDLDTMLAAML